MTAWMWPRFNRGAWMVFRRNYLAWSKFATSSILLNFGEPFTGLLALGFGLGSFVAKMEGVPFVAYIGPGLLAVTSMNAVAYDMGWEVFARLNENGIYHSMIGAPLSAPEIVGGEYLWQMFRSLLYGVVFLVVLLALGLVRSWWVLALPFPLLVEGLLFAAPSLWAATVSRTHEHLFYYFSLVVTPLFMFSGVFFPVSSLPAWARDVVIATPLYHFVRIMRHMVLGTPIPGWGSDVAWIVAWSVVLAVLPVGLLHRRLVE